MTSPDAEPGPEQLAAYLDGEFEHLGGLTPDTVEHLLSNDPEATAQARAHRRLNQLWQRSAPEEPAPAAWRGVFARIERGLDHLPRPWHRQRRRWGIGVGIVGAIAACVAVAVWLSGRPNDRSVPGPVVDAPVAEAVFPIAREDEVEILSVRGADVPSLVTGALPLQGLLVLASPGEVNLIRSSPATEDRALPEVRMNDDETPMVWASAPVETKQPQPTP
jgi:hypothetical protein